MRAAYRLQTYSRVDPSSTLTLRNAFASQMRKRFRELQGVIKRAIVDQDVFGLRPVNVVSIRSIRIFQMQTPPRRAFAFERSGQQVASFMDWLDDQVNAGILETREFQRLGRSVEDAWTNVFIDSAYQQGIRNGRAELIAAGHEVPNLEAEGGIEAVFNSPFHADRVGLLYTRTYGDLKQITDTMQGQIRRVLSQGMAEGRGPAQIARMLNRTITGPSGDLGLTDTLGRFIPAKRRAVILARTEIIRAHAEAELQDYENFGVFGVTAKVELRTAGDTRVCPICEDLDGDVYTIKKARGIIPVHPQCRCTWIPLDPEGEKPEQPEEPEPSPAAGGFVPAATAAEAISRLHAFTKPLDPNQRFYKDDEWTQGIFFEKAKLPELNQILEGIENSIGKYDIKVNRIGFAKRTRNYGQFSWKYNIDATKIELQKTRTLNWQKAWKEENQRNISRRAAFIRKYESNIAFYKERGIPEMVRYNEEKLAFAKDAKTWSVSSHPDVEGRNILATTIHEGYHAIYRKHEDILKTTWAEELRKVYPDPKDIKIDANKISEYAGTKLTEMWAETGAAIQLGIEIPDPIRQAFMASMKQVEIRQQFERLRRIQEGQ